MYGSDHAEPQIRGRYRWFISTCLAAAVGGIAILVVIFGSSDHHDAADGIMPALKRMTDNVVTPPLEPLPRRDEGLKWSVPRTDRLQVLTGAMSTRYIIHETLRQKRGGREYIYAKPYVRLVARLASVPAKEAASIPPFNPFKLYADSTPVGTEGEGAQAAIGSSDVSDPRGRASRRHPPAGGRPGTRRG